MASLSRGLTLYGLELDGMQATPTRRTSSCRRFRIASNSRVMRRSASCFSARVSSCRSLATGRERPNVVSVGAALALLGLSLAWGLYRLERSASRRRDIDAARGLLLGVKRGMVGGWGDEYFAQRWTAAAAEGAAQHHKDLVLKRGYEQILVVPTEPLAALVSNPAAGSLISEDTVAAASLGLWHVEGFNQLVGQHSGMLAEYLVEMSDPNTPQARREAIASAIGVQARMLHRRGVGEPDEEGGWYRRLKESVDADLARLHDLGRRRWTRKEWWLPVGDIAASGAALLAVIALISATT